MRIDQTRPTGQVLNLLRLAHDSGASDLHLIPDSVPCLRVHGRLVAANQLQSSLEETRNLAYGIMSDRQKSRFERLQEIDFSFEVEGLSRFRANVFTRRGKTAAVVRLIPLQVKPLEELGLPPVVERLAGRPHGLILVAGSSGSGKSTTLAALIDRINRTRAKHIITIEDPIEFVHDNHMSVVSQREVPGDSPSFGSALRTALRQDPDVVLVGEMRDSETIETTLRLAETGHLTLSTLHTRSAPDTIGRILDMFPADQQGRIQSLLSSVLEGIVCQVLIRCREGGGRAAAAEVLIPNPAIRNLIREHKLHQIRSAMQTGQSGSGMRTLNQSLAELVREGRISYEACLEVSPDTVDLKRCLDLSDVAAEAASVRRR